MTTIKIAFKVPVVPLKISRLFEQATPETMCKFPSVSSKTHYRFETAALVPEFPTVP
jgi:hypothetical protein